MRCGVLRCVRASLTTAAHVAGATAAAAGLLHCNRPGALQRRGSAGALRGRGGACCAPPALQARKKGIGVSYPKRNASRGQAGGVILVEALVQPDAGDGLAAAVALLAQQSGSCEAGGNKQRYCPSHRRSHDQPSKTSAAATKQHESRRRAGLERVAFLPVRGTRPEPSFIFEISRVDTSRKVRRRAGRPLLSAYELRSA